jgi:DNA-binding beta-propeller fold protein YncE/mono/diheme cytochrome c family protein
MRNSQTLQVVLLRMRRPIALLLALLVAPTIRANASEKDDWSEEDEFSPAPVFQLEGRGIGGVRATSSVAPAHAASSRIAALGEGAAALVIDADSGKLFRTDEKGARIAELAIGSEAGLLAYDPPSKRAFVADRRGDRIVVVEVGDTLRVTASWKTPAEPYGIALTPDRKTLLVTTIADRTLVAFDAATGKQQWRTTLGAEPRGIAISPDGTRAVITSLVTGGVDEVSLGETSHAARTIALPTGDKLRHARGAFAAAFVGDHAVLPFQLDTPVASFPSGDQYGGGGSSPPITHHLAWLGSNGRRAFGETNVHEPRALAWDPAQDTLYLVGLASDEVVAVKRASQIDPEVSVTRLITGQRCGADGIAIARDGTVITWCSFTRSLAFFTPTPKTRLATNGPELAPSMLDETRHAGLVLFHSANEHISSFGGISCGNCHLDGRADGLSWLIKGHELQTPMLTGRLSETAPFKWDGGAVDLAKSLRETMGRLGGSGLSKKDLASLVAFLEGLPAPRAPSVADTAAVERGKRVFEGDQAGCASCHDGPHYTDRMRHELTGTFDTPSLVGLAASAPYFHDGSATNLEAVVLARGRVHGMADDATKLDARDVTDLVAFLRTL